MHSRLTLSLEVTPPLRPLPNGTSPLFPSAIASSKISRMSGSVQSDPSEPDALPVFDCRIRVAGFRCFRRATPHAVDCLYRLFMCLLSAIEDGNAIPQPGHRTSTAPLLVRARPLGPGPADSESESDSEFLTLSCSVACFLPSASFRNLAALIACVPVPRASLLQVSTAPFISLAPVTVEPSALNFLFDLKSRCSSRYAKQT